jgi:segregation and condensation protein A
MEADSIVQLEVSIQAFEGPFDLLLALIRKNQYPIDDLPLVEITAQFLAYIREARELDMDLGAEFMEAGSWLVLLKSRSMLPRESAATAQNELRAGIQKYELERERLDLAKLLLEGFGSKRPRVPASRAARGRGTSEVDEEMAPDASEVARRVRSAIASARARASFSTMELAALTVEEQKAWVLVQLAAYPAGTPFSTEEWFAAQTAASSKASLFLALLELGRTGDVLLNQRCDFGSIHLKRPDNNGSRERELIDAPAV